MYSSCLTCATYSFISFPFLFFFFSVTHIIILQSLSDVARSLPEPPDECTVAEQKVHFILARTFSVTGIGAVGLPAFDTLPKLVSLLIQFLI